jgi:hypothetical protein
MKKKKLDLNIKFLLNHIVNEKNIEINRKLINKMIYNTKFIYFKKINYNFIKI